MLKKIGIISISIVVTFALFWMAQALIQETKVEAKRPHLITMPKIPTRQTQYLEFPPDGKSPPDTRIVCCEGCWLPYPHKTEIARLFKPNFKGTVARIEGEHINHTHYQISYSDLEKGRWRVPTLDITYPRSQIELGREGEVLVEVILFPDGKVASATVLKASASKSLERAALMAMKVSKFPSPIVDGEQTLPSKRRVLIRFQLSH
ncbi:MAG: TonB family protein [Alphaproteobacteria bacterium]|nr:TonB family protein [Alphaproteobacteria bacterium]